MSDKNEALLNQLNEKIAPNITKQLKMEELTEKERAAIEAGLKDIGNGETITWEELKKK